MRGNLRNQLSLEGDDLFLDNTPADDITESVTKLEKGAQENRENEAKTKARHRNKSYGDIRAPVPVSRC